MARSRSKLFPDGWGSLPADTPTIRPLTVAWTPLAQKQDLHIADGHFLSPAPVPPAAVQGSIRWLQPVGSTSVCLLLAASNEEGYGRREVLARDLARHGIGTLILENPFYGTRRVHQGTPPIRTVAELLTMGSAAMQEAAGILLGFDDRYTLGVGGYSMGGNIAGLVAASYPEAITAVLMAPSPSPASVFTEGLLSAVVDWEALGGRTAAEPHLREVLDRASILSFPPPASPELAIIVGARGDGYIPAEAVESIHHHWPGSELRWAPGGHITLASIGRAHLVEAIVDAFKIR